jgi:hypothetical protein
MVSMYERSARFACPSKNRIQPPRLFSSCRVAPALRSTWWRRRCKTPPAPKRISSAPSSPSNHCGHQRPNKTSRLPIDPSMQELVGYSDDSACADGLVGVNIRASFRGGMLMTKKKTKRVIVRPLEAVGWLGTSGYQTIVARKVMLVSSTAKRPGKITAGSPLTVPRSAAVIMQRG